MKKASPKNFGKMEVDEEAESKKKLHAAKERAARSNSHGEADEFPDVLSQVLWSSIKETPWQQEVQDIEHRRKDLLPEHRSRHMGQPAPGGRNEGVSERLCI